MKKTPAMLAEHMFDAYGAHCDWKAWDGRPMPKWDEVNDAVRSHWVVAAEAAIKWIGQGDDLASE